MTRALVLNGEYFCMFIIVLLLLMIFQTTEQDNSPAAPCDYVYTSAERKSGTFSSPGYPSPYPPDATCRYLLVGNTTADRVQLKFTDFELSYPFGDPKDPENCEDADSVTVTVTHGKAPTDLEVICGDRRPPLLMSHNNQMEVTFVSRGSHGAKGFKAMYSFVTDYGIKAHDRDSRVACGFVYKSAHGSTGRFTSPNFPGLYPRRTECHYLFYGRDNERVNITFEKFTVEGDSNKGCSSDSRSDFVEFSNYDISIIDRKLIRYCGSLAELVSRHVVSDSNFFRVTFKSNEIYDETGFEASFHFINATDPNQKVKEKSEDKKSRSSTIVCLKWTVVVCMFFALHN